MTHKDIYTKFMIEYDKANVTSSYPSLTEYEVATVLDKAYNALISLKVTGNNLRRVPLEGDLKNISDIAPLITNKATNLLTKVSNSNIVYCAVPEGMLYFVSGSMTQTKSNTLDNISTRLLPLKLVSHQAANKFIASAYNMPWIKTPVCYIEDNKLYIVYDSVNTPTVTNASITYIKSPNKFVKNLNDFSGLAGSCSYFNPPVYTEAEHPEGWESYTEELKTAWNTNEEDRHQQYINANNKYIFECNDTVAEELISLAITFALENIESQRLNSKLNMRGLEA